MKKWWNAEEEKDKPVDEPTNEWIKKNYVQDSCTHEPDAYLECISCVMNLLLEKCKCLEEENKTMRLDRG